MRTRHTGGDWIEDEALREIPGVLVGECAAAARHGWDAGLKCRVLDAYDRARLGGARASKIAEVLSLSSTSSITRWRRQRQRLVSAAGDFLLSLGVR